MRLIYNKINGADDMTYNGGFKHGMFHGLGSAYYLNGDNYIG